MNKFYTLIIAFVLICISSVNAQNREYTVDTLSMYPGYSNDVFYSMSDGEVANVPRSGWDMAFYTDAFSAGIIINEGDGVMLYKYPAGDTSAWANVDTTGLSSWTPIYNSPEFWEDGAFNNGALGHPDYGWGIYNMVTHSLIGDSLYIINTPSSGLKKLWIVNKISVENTYHIKYANLDGSDEMMVTLDISPYTGKNFVYYSIANDQLIDREPNQDWDLLFTKYIDLTPDNAGNMVEYLVTGATSNVNHPGNRFTEVGPDFDDWTAKPLDSLKNVVGYDWKAFDMSTFSWQVDDSACFFVRNITGDVYKLIFTYWAGMGSGDFALNKEVVSAAGIGDIIIVEDMISLYPNPASQTVSIDIMDAQFEGDILITDISGRLIYKAQINDSQVINVSEFTKGIYFVTISNQNYKESQKLIIK